MSINVEWDGDEKTAVRFTYLGQWTLPEFYTAIDQSNAMMAEVGRKVNVIIDTRKSNALPNNFISVMRMMPSKASPNTGTIVIVGANAFIRAFANTIARLFPSEQQRKVILADTLDSARSELAKQLGRAVQG